MMIYVKPESQNTSKSGSATARPECAENGQVHAGTYRG